MKRVLVTGATGLIGRRLILALKQRGDKAIVLSTNKQSAKKILPDVQKIVSWDDFLSLASEPIDAIVNLAGVNLALKRWSESFKKEIYDSRIESTRKIVELISLMNHKPGVLLNSSGVDYYPDLGDKEIYEDTPCGNSFISKTVSDWEAEAMKASSRVVCLRTGLVIAREAKSIKKLSLPFKLFIGGHIGNGKQYMSWIHIEDLLAIILFAMDNSNVTGALNCTAPYPESNKDFCKHLASVLHRPSFFPVPGFVVKIIAGDMSELVLKGRKAIPKKIIRFGYRFKYEKVIDALREALG